MGKYRYETRPDLSSDQRKYISQSSDLVIKSWIANELAESNRLKRIELRQKQGLYADYNVCKFNSVLKDEA